MSGEDEIKEAYYAFSHLGCEEQMWDCEGKEVVAFNFKIDYEHKKVTSRIVKGIKENDADLQSMIEEAAYLRRFLG